MNKFLFHTEVLDKQRQSVVLDCVVKFLEQKLVTQVSVEFGFVIERDLEGKNQGRDTTVPIGDFKAFVEQGLEEGTIEWSGLSDFYFSPVDPNGI